jgi:hypothetical protein
VRFDERYCRLIPWFTSTFDSTSLPWDRVLDTLRVQSEVVTVNVTFWQVRLGRRPCELSGALE